MFVLGVAVLGGLVGVILGAGGLGVLGVSFWVVGVVGLVLAVLGVWSLAAAAGGVVLVVGGLGVLGVLLWVVGVPFVPVPGLLPGGLLPGRGLGVVACPGGVLVAAVCGGLGPLDAGLAVLLGSSHLRAGSLKGR